MASSEIQTIFQAWEERFHRHDSSEKPFTVSFCGVFSSGKSSLINALLQCDFQLPTGIEPVTRTVTRIRYGAKPRIFYRKDGQEKELEEASAHEIISGGRKLPGEGGEIVLELPSELLQNNIELMDTPGYDDETAMEDISRAAVMEADLIVFCANAAMLGKEFEREYLDELRDSHGNFCLVVNRIDCLNTDEEFEDILHTARRLMSGRGNAAHPDRPGYAFFTVATGELKTLNGLDRYIHDLACSPEERARVMRSTNQCHTRMLAVQMRDRMAEAQEVMEQRLSELKERNQQQLQDRLRDYNVRLTMLERACDQGNVLFTEQSEQAAERYAQRANRIQDRSKFVREATDIAVAVITDMAEHMIDFVEREEITDRSRAEDALIVNPAFTIPEPTGHWEKRRGFFGRTLYTIGNLLDGDLSIDDGEDWIQDDHQTPAQQAVQSQLIDYLYKKWKALLESAQKDFKKQKPNQGGLEDEIGALRGEWSDQEIQYANHLERMNDAAVGQPPSPLPKPSHKGADALRAMREALHGALNDLWEMRKDADLLSEEAASLDHQYGMLQGVSAKVAVVGGPASGPTILLSAMLRREVRLLPSVSHARVSCDGWERVELCDGEGFCRLRMSLEEYADCLCQSDALSAFSGISSVHFYLRPQGFGDDLLAWDVLYTPDSEKAESALCSEALARADAVIYVLDAADPFTAADARFMTEHLAGRKDGVFFAINRVDQYGEGTLARWRRGFRKRLDKRLLKKPIRTELSGMFAGANGKLDRRMMKRRVFHCTAQGAQQARNDGKASGRPSMRERRTGLPKLESALAAYLNQPEVTQLLVAGNEQASSVGLDA